MEDRVSKTEKISVLMRLEVKMRLLSDLLAEDDEEAADVASRDAAIIRAISADYGVDLKQSLLQA